VRSAVVVPMQREAVARVGLVRPVPLLPTAAGWWDAAAVGGGRLTDLSGNGRDAVFGAGAAAPVVLPWDGEDYLHFPDTGAAADASVANYVQSQAVSIPATAVVSLQATVTIDKYPVDSYAIVVDTSAIVALRLNISRTGAIYSANPSVTTVTTAAGAVAVGERATIRVDYDGTTAKIFKNGTEIASAAYTYSGTKAGLSRATVNFTTRKLIGRVHSASMSVGGAVVCSFDRVRAVDSTYTAIRGSIGGDWKVTRAATGYKTAVVDRPLLLFGGGQHAQAPSPGTVQAATVVVAYRNFAQTPSRQQQFFDSAFSTTATPGIGFLICGAGQSSPGATLVTTNTSGGGYLVHNLGVRPIGQALLAAAVDDGRRSIYENGTLRFSSAGPSGGMALQPPTIGASSDITKFQADMEFIAAAVFDRALTDDEVTRAGLELLGDPRTVDARARSVADLAPARGTTLSAPARTVQNP
jgi:hypothetical protein